MNAAAEAPTWTAPTVVIPLLAALLALAGVIWSNLYGAHRARTSEDLRHQNSLKYHRETRLREVRFDAYARLLTAAREAHVAARDAIGYPHETFDDWLKLIPNRRQRLIERSEALALPVSEVMLLGSKETATYAQAFDGMIGQVLAAAVWASNENDRELNETSKEHHPATLEHLLKKLTEQLRLELGVQAPHADVPPTKRTES
ncbi:hypothetical protein [Isoptericola sp. QY 916]|uniref:hypothetical protein n=1 Tax=Isoptericola sp. QY 916 TaxID=2782570 RepID=UPI003D2FB240|nr:hypothetical protein [Isoptericola sp. QY 916]